MKCIFFELCDIVTSFFLVSTVVGCILTELKEGYSDRVVCCTSLEMFQDSINRSRYDTSKFCRVHLSFHCVRFSSAYREMNILSSDIDHRKDPHGEELNEKVTVEIADIMLTIPV